MGGRRGCCARYGRHPGYIRNRRPQAPQSDPAVPGVGAIDRLDVQWAAPGCSSVWMTSTRPVLELLLECSKLDRELFGVVLGRLQDRREDAVQDSVAASSDLLPGTSTRLLP